MKHYKLLMASLLLAIGGGSAVAQTDEPVLKLQNVSNEAYNVTDLNNFVVKADKYSLTVVGTIGQEITVRGDYGSKYVYFKYTPTSSTNVRFFRNNGKVYVYEGDDFKQELEEHVATANPIMVDGNVVDNDAQMLKDASFENHGKKYADNKYYLGSDWTTNTDFKSTNIRVTEDQNSVKDGKSKLLWRGTKCDRYFSQQISGLKPNTYYSIQLSQLDCANANADFNIGFGTSAGDLSICATTVRLGKDTSKGKLVRLVKTPEIIPSGNIYFTFSCTKDNSSNNPNQTDVLTHLDWVSVTEDKSSNEFLGVSGITAANYVENVVDEPNMVVVNAYKEKFKDCNKENPSGDVLINGSCDVANSGWVLSNMGYQQNKERPTRYVEKWVSSANNGRLSGKYSASQTVYDIPAGVYVLTGTLQAILQGKSLAITGASLNLNDKSVSVSGEWKDYSVTYVLKRDGELTASYVINNSNANWVAMDGLSLKYTQSYLDYLKEQYAVVKATATETLNNTDYAAVKGLEKTELANAINQNAEETTNALEAAISNLESAISAFTSAKTAYDNYAEEAAVAEKFGITVDTPNTAADATEALKTLNVEEYNAATKDYTAAIELGEWTTTGATKFNNEHWSGKPSDYLNQIDKDGKGYNSDNWTMTCKQTLTLPAGEYVFKAAGRKSANAFMKLSVKNGEILVGEVSNFPNGNVGLGITTDGKASFDSNDNFANNNNGWGWQWRFVPFTLDADTEITFEIEAGANAIRNWASFGDYTVMAKPSVDASLTVYNQAVEAANAALAVEANKVVTGDELTKLNAALNVDKGTTMESIDAATKNIQECTTAFTAAQPKYQALVDAKKLEQEELAYASKDKYTAFTKSKDAIPTDATDAEAKAKDIIAARRAYVESNGMAEGVEGAVDCTDKVENPTFTESDKGWTSEVEGGRLQTINNETWTNSNWSNGSSYYDYNNDDANRQHVYQEVTGLATGKYIVTIKARAQSNFNLYLLINDEKKVDINEIGNTGGVFDRGWNDYTAEFTVGADGKVKIEVANMPNVKQSGWFSFGDVRLVRLGNLDAVTLNEAADNTIKAKVADVTLERTLKAEKWNTLVLPFSVSADKVKEIFGEGVKIATYSNDEGEVINFTTTEDVKANVPVLIKPATVSAENTYTFDGVTLVAAKPKTDGTSYSFVGSYKPYNLVNDDYMLYADKWWKTETGDSYKIKAFRAYIKANTSAAAKQLNLVIDGQTTGLKLNTVNGNIEGETYNIAGQRVANSYKGLVIKNGKKIIKK